MKVTKQTTDKIMRAMTAKGMKQVELAEKVGVHRSYISRLLAGDYPTIPDEQAVKIGDALDLRLLKLVYEEGSVSETALRLTAHADADPAFSSVLETLLEMKEGDPRDAFLPSVSQEKLGEIGAEAIRLAFMWEDGDETRKIKVGADLLTFLRELYRKGDF